MRTTCTWESGRCKTMLSPPGICWWPATHAKVKTPYVGDGHPSFNKEIIILIKTPTIGLMIIPYYIGNNGSLDPSTIIVITLPNLWRVSDNIGMLIFHVLRQKTLPSPSNLARRHAMASSRESCPWPNFIKFLNQKLNRNKIEQFDNGSVRNRNKSPRAFSQAPCADASV